MAWLTNHWTLPRSADKAINLKRPLSSELYRWSRQAQAVVSASNPGNLTIDMEECGVKQHWDLSSPREWLEFWENKCKYPGAYTVVRCDLQIPRSSQAESKWRVWGKDFHWERLKKSIQCINHGLEPLDLKRYQELSEQLLKLLLIDAHKSALKHLQQTETESFFNESVFIYMLTLLWQPSNNPLNCVQVKGHIFSTLVPDSAQANDPAPIVAVLAMPDPDHSWPNRWSNSPSAKISSWCRQRRPLENILKVPGIGEVLLARTTPSQQRNTSTVEILEGLVTNVFFVYPGGIIRTAQDGVLAGYARHLVIHSAEESGLTYADGKEEGNPITIEDRHLWQEVFVASSIRIIVPVKEIILPVFANEANTQETKDNEAWQAQTLWSYNSSESGAGPLWKRLRNEILKMNA